MASRGLLKESVHEIDLDGLDFTGRTNYGGGGGEIRFYALAEGVTLGNPVPVVRQIHTGLVDGTFQVTDRHDNANPQFKILVEADNSALLDQAQAMLFNACRDGVTLGWKPPDGWGERRLYHAYTSSPQWLFDDMDELRLQRTFSVNIERDPWAYSQAQVSVVASSTAPVSPTTTTISDGTSATGWSSPPGVTAPAVSSGKLRITPRSAGIEGTYVSETTFTSTAMDYSATPYITAEIKPETGMRLWPTPDGSAGVSYVQPPSKDGGITTPSQVLTSDASSLRGNPAAWAGCFVDGAKLQLVTYTTLADGTVRYTWRSTDASATTLRFVVGTALNQVSPPTNKGFLLDNVTRSNVNPVATSSGRASLLTLVAEGSARTAPQIAIEHATSTLGEVVFYTSWALGSAGYGGPSLKPFLVAGSVTTDTSAVSGSYSTMSDGISAPIRWSVPANQLPAGSYLIMIRVKSGGGSVDKVCTMTVSQIEGTTEYGEKVLPGTVTALGSGSGAPYSDLKILGVVTLPRQKAPPESGAAVQFELTSEDVEAGNTLRVDDLWAFHLGEGSDYTRVNCGGTGSPSLGVRHNRMWMDVATPLRPDPGLYVGTAADRADAFDPGYPAVICRGTHPLNAGVNRCYVITTLARNPTITYTYTPAWF